MPRLHILHLPTDQFGERFAFILDQATPMHEAAVAAWQSFAEKCGALDIMFTADTIDIDPEISDGWTPDDDEPVGYGPAEQCCGPRVITPLDLVSMVQAAHAAAWEPWAPANLDPESPKISTHPAASCAAVNNEALGCPMHAPILDGPWAEWPFFAANPADIGPTIVRICDHGISHPTPEEYLGGFDTPHLCDGCPCAPVADFSIVVSDLANTRLPRGTLLLGVKDEPGISPEWPDRLAKQNRDEVGRFINDDPTPVTAPPATAGGAMDAVRANIEDVYARSGLVAPAASFPFLSAPEVPGADAEPGSVRRGGTARVQPLGADGEPIGEAKDYPLAGPVEVTEKEYGTEVSAVLAEQAFEPFGSSPLGPDEVRLCVAASNGARCTREYRHDGLHEFGPFTRV
jgi:hypothetical protein